MSPFGVGHFASVPPPRRSVLLSKAFWSAAAERAVKTFAQALVAIIGIAGLTPADIDWKQALGGAGIAAFASLLTSVAASGVGNDGPSFATESIDKPAA